MIASKDILIFIIIGRFFLSGLFHRFFFCKLLRSFLCKNYIVPTTHLLSERLKNNNKKILTSSNVLSCCRCGGPRMRYLFTVTAVRSLSSSSRRNDESLFLTMQIHPKTPNTINDKLVTDSPIPQCEPKINIYVSCRIW